MTQLKQKGDLFSVKVKKEKKGSKGKKKKKQEGDREVHVKKTPKAERLSALDVQPLTYKSLTVGQVLLGCVSEVRDYELVVSLPHKLVGSISLAHISRPYTALLSKLKDDEEGEEEIQALQELYQPGQHVVCSVVSIEKVNNMTRVSLTLMPNEVNFGISASCLEKGLVLPCAVASLEDKGYVMDTGIPKIKAAFLKREDTDKAQTLGVGSVLRCVVTNIFGSDTKDNLRLTLSANPKAVSSATLDLSDTTNLALLLPGTAVNTTISKIRSDALTLMLAGLDGVVSPLHLAQPFDQLQQYGLGDSVRGRVLYVMPLSKVVHFTLQKNVCTTGLAKDPKDGHEIGDIVREAEIYKSSPSGIFLSLGGKARGFCSANHISDNTKVLMHINRDFRVGKKVPCRLLKYNHMDQLFIVTLQKSVLEQQFIAYSELQPGQVVQATVNSYDSNGARLAVSKLMSGHVPSLHLTDGPMKHPERKHIVGDQVTARVLKVNSKRQHLLLTLKSQLVTAKEPILTEYSQEAENTLTIGYVIKVLPQGLLVGMFNDVKGFIPRSQVSIESGMSLASAFHEGQVVRCRVLKVSPEKQNITLSLLVDEDVQPLSRVPKSARKVEMRARVRCVVDEVRTHVITVTVLPHNVEASIPVHHLSDDPSKCQLLREVLKEGDEITNAVVFSKVPGSPITLTLKPSVCFWADGDTPDAPHSQEELVAEESYPAVVLSVKNYGVFVTIPSGSAGTRALVHMKNLVNPGKWVGSKNLGISVGQSLYVTYKDKDDKGRPILTSALKDNLKNPMQSSLQLLYSYLKNEEMVARGMLNSKGQGKRLTRFGVGDKVVAIVTKLMSDEVHVIVKNSSVAGLVPCGHQHGKAALKVGQKVKAVVLHVNQEDKRLDLTLKPSLIFNLNGNKNAEVKTGMKAKCEVVLSKSTFTMVMMRSTCKGTVAYLPSRMHLNVLNGGPLSTAVGKRCWVAVKHVEAGLVLGVLRCHDSGEGFTPATQLPEISFTPCAGDTDSEAEQEEEAESDAEEGSNDANSSGAVQGGEASTGEVVHPEKGTKRPADDDASQTSEEAQQGTRMRQLKDNEAKKTKKIKIEKDASQDKAEEGVEQGADSSPSEDSREEMKVSEGEVSGAKPCLTLGTGFVWEVPDTPELMDSSDSEDQDVPKKKEKRMRKSEMIAQSKEEEQRLHQLELSRLEEGRSPQSAMDFEAMLQGSPNSSAVWIQFISFHLESAEVDKAKAVARRALQVMDAQEEEERLNVWTVLLRLEVLYGGPESVAEAYREALATNDQLKVHLAMAMVYAESDKLKEAERVYFNMSKKFSQELSVWVKAGIFFFSHNMAGEGRRFFERALCSLDKKDHVELINRFGQLEFRFGETERGRTMFESLLSTYWKRLDIWSVYVDLLTKAKDTEGARNVLERMTGLKLRIRKMRFVFKKFMDFEKEHGTPQSVEAVKRRVEEFVAAAIH